MRTILALLLGLTVAGPHRGFASPGDPPPGDLVLTGIVQIGGQSHVCLANTRDGRATWYTVGAQRDGLWVQSVDAATDEVVVRSGSTQIRIGLRQAVIQELGVARLDDGSVDWVHMKMSDAEKAHEAQLLMWDILEVGRLARGMHARAP